MSLKNDKLCDMCSKLNEGQQYLFNFIMKYANEIWLAEKNDKSHTESYNEFLSGGTGVKKKCFSQFRYGVFKEKFEICWSNT